MLDLVFKANVVFCAAKVEKTIINIANNTMTVRSVYPFNETHKEQGYIHRVPMEEGIRQVLRARKQSK